MKISDIKWDVNIEHLTKKVNNSSLDETTNMLQIPKWTWGSMSITERNDYLYETYDGKPDLIQKALHLPEEVDIPPEIIEKYGVYDFLKDKYGYDMMDCSVEKEIEQEPEEIER